MLTENDVIEALATFLMSQGYRIEHKLTTLQKGIDIVGVFDGDGRRLLIEAKGGTSSKEYTRRFGKGFSATQARHHVARAFYYAAKLQCRYPTDVVAIAFPDDIRHQSAVEAIKATLIRLNIHVYFVAEDRTVCVMAPSGQASATPSPSPAPPQTPGQP